MSDTKFCPECGEKVSADDAFCGMCGAALPQTKVESTPTTPVPPVVKDVETESEIEKEDGKPFYSRVRGVLAFIVILVIIVNVGKWLRWPGEDEPPESETITFNEWIQQDRFQPEIPKKHGFSDLNETKSGGSSIPYTYGEVFVSGVLQTNCESGVNDLSFELSVGSDGTTTGDFLSDGWFHAPLRGSMTPSGELQVSGKLTLGGDIQINGNLRYDGTSDFLKGGGQFRLDGRGPRGSVQCAGEWLTEVLR